MEKQLSLRDPRRRVVVVIRPGNVNLRYWGFTVN